MASRCATPLPPSLSLSPPSPAPAPAPALRRASSSPTRAHAGTRWRPLTSGSPSPRRRLRTSACRKFSRGGLTRLCWPEGPLRGVSAVGARRSGPLGLRPAPAAGGHGSPCPSPPMGRPARLPATASRQLRAAAGRAVWRGGRFVTALELRLLLEGPASRANRGATVRAALLRLAARTPGRACDYRGHPAVYAAIR
jgi:hypothetical protein